MPPPGLISRIDDLTRFDFISAEEVSAMKAQIPAIAKRFDAERLYCTTDEQVFFAYYQLRNDPAVKAWHDAFLKVAVVTASSASIERLFSFFERMFDDTQVGAFRRYIEAAVLLRFNGRRP
mgnify:CR=1 FL=1